VITVKRENLRETAREYARSNDLRFWVAFLDGFGAGEYDGVATDGSRSKAVVGEG
jgi:hypothetical protein